MLAAVCSSLIGAPLLGAAQGEDSKAEAPFECATPPEPVVSLSIGSRYQKDSATRSEIAEESNEEVDKALEPVEAFINDVSQMANAAYLKQADGPAKADCAMGWLRAWAEGDALTQLDSLNARLAVSPRLAGLALAFLQAQPTATPGEGRDKPTIAWFNGQAEAVIVFFETEAGPLASTNNLRAWATLAMASTGAITGDEKTLTWARDSYKLLVCGAGEDGAFPAEMERGERALHYQLHALAPLVVAIGLLDPEGKADEELCRSKLETIADFTLAAVQEPKLVADLVGKDQVFSGDDESKPAPYQLAWAEPYLARYPDAALEAYIKPLRPLRYSKLGGDLTAVYGADR
ncbi:MAG: alginate lyase family protein [Devosia sp.]